MDKHKRSMFIGPLVVVGCAVAILAVIYLVLLWSES